VTSRAAVLAVLLAAAGPGLLFAPVFGIAPLLLPLALVVLVGFAVAEACRRWPGLVPWRAVLVVVLGLVALSEALLFSTTMAGVPTVDTGRALVAGMTESWQLTLQSTWPARPDPELVLFVPLAVLAAAVSGMELLIRVRRPLVAVLPGLAVLALSQAYVALTGVTAMIAAFVFCLLAAVVLSSTDDSDDAVPSPTGRRAVVALVLVAPTVVMAVAGVVLATAADPVDRQPYSLRDKQFAPLPPDRVASPLDEMADRLQDPDEPVFTYSTDDPVDRWRMVVLDSFNGVGWTPSPQPRRLGTVLVPGQVTVSKTEHSARIRYPGTEEPWLPSQALPASVSGLAPLVDETSGTLIARDRTGPVEYGLSWWEPNPSTKELRNAAIDPDARTGYGGLGAVPEGITELANQAVRETRPAFQTALVLERYLKTNYERAEGDVLPSGSGWPQLEDFLLESKLGTTEQFAAAYVVLARIIGLPARIAVGYRAPAETGDEVVVRNGDVMAWPEVAVAGIGWVPLDPAGATSGTGARPRGLAEATAEARDQLPPEDEVKDPELSEDDEETSAGAEGSGISVPVVPVLVAAGALAVLWLVGVPTAVGVRGWRRRRRPGAAAVVGAWQEARDRLRAHGVPYTAGMTVRDLATKTPEPAVRQGLQSLAGAVDKALWSQTGPGPTTADEAWQAVRAVRRGLAQRPWKARVRAALTARTLRPPRR
jgi:protein-glutamine gamma-glutamyltransferase